MMKQVGQDLVKRLKHSWASMTARGLTAKNLQPKNEKLAADCKEAATLLRIVYEMLEDQTPLTHWDLVETRIRDIVVNPADQEDKIKRIMEVVKEVSGE